MSSTEHEPRSRTVMAQTPVRALTFLRGVALSPVIYATLAANGYTPKEHQHGWTLLCSVSGFRPNTAIVEPTEDELRARDALATIDAWDEPGFRRARAALTRLHSTQAEFVFDGLVAAQGPESVLRVSTFLDRLDALESGDERRGSRKADAAALKTLAARGIDKAERARLRALIKEAQGVPQAASPIAMVPDVEQRERDLAELRAWYEDWSETARALLTRREHLIRLGLARRKKSGKLAGSDEPGRAGEGEGDDAKPGVVVAPSPGAGPGERPAPVARPVTPRPSA